MVVVSLFVLEVSMFQFFGRFCLTAKLAVLFLLSFLAGSVPWRAAHAQSADAQSTDFERAVIVGGDMGDGRYVVDLAGQADEEIRGLYLLLKRLFDKPTVTSASTFAFGLVQREFVVVRRLSPLGNKSPATNNWTAVVQVTAQEGFRQYDNFGLAVGDAASITTVDGYRSSIMGATSQHWIEWNPTLKQLVITSMSSDAMTMGPVEFEGAFSLRAKSVTSFLNTKQSVSGSLESNDKTVDAKVSFSSETSVGKKRLLVDLAGLSYRFSSGLVSVSRMSSPALSELRIGFRSMFVSEGSIVANQVIGTVDTSVCTSKRVISGSGKLVDKVLVLGADLTQEARCASDANQVAANVSFNVHPGSRAGAYNVLSLVSQPTGIKNRNKAFCEVVFGSTFSYQFSASAGPATISTAENRQGETRPDVLVTTNW